MYKLHFNFYHIGDQVCTTALPENIFKFTGERVVIADPKIWAFKHNPYATFMTEEEAKDITTIDIVPDARIQQHVELYYKTMQTTTMHSQTEFMCRSFNLTNVTLRHPRLYIYEDEKIQPNKIVVHTSGSDRTRDGEPAIRTSLGEDAERIMSAEVMATILKNYSDYQIIQVGGKDDIPLGGHSIDRRGQYDYWQTAKEIATSAKFIGVNSGPMHIANCYPRVEKRIVLMEYPQSTLIQYQPGDIRNMLFSWLDPANTHFNKFDRDVGATFSYRNI